MKEPTAASSMRRSTIAIDVAKSVFQVAVSARPGRVDRQQRLSRGRLLEFIARQPPALVVMEACGSSHHWGREIAALGHEVRLLPAQYVHKYRIGSKTDRRDTEAMLEAQRREALRPVPVKSTEEQTIATLHRLRSGWMSTRTARLNGLRGALREFGLVVAVGANRVLPAVQEAMRSAALPQPLVHALSDMCDEVRSLERRIKAVEAQLEALSAESPVVTRLRTIPGIGLLSATALVSAMGDARRFPSGRHLASFLGLVPKEHSSGTRRRLGTITKQGDLYVRTLLIAGARSVLAHARRQKHPDRLRRWALSVEASRGHNRAAIALANRIARIAWAVWTKERDYDSEPIALPII